MALSGGVDSSVLLHLLRFTPGIPRLGLLAAHFDHQMRPDSPLDLLWVKGLCLAWGIPLETGEARVPPTSETQARELRYEFLKEVKGQAGASWIVTGHQGDDQAETVLFRVFRGTGLRGLAGIPKVRTPGLYRPLLPFSRDEILGYARSKGIRFLQDPTNRDLGNPRNFLRHGVLPQLQKELAPRVKESLQRLARLAGENEAAWESLFPELLDGVLVEEKGAVFIVRSGLLAYHPAVRARLLREIFRRQGIELDEAGTRAAVEFTTTSSSGRSATLPGGVRLTRDFDRLTLEVPSTSVDDQDRGGAWEPEEGKDVLVLSGPGPGSGRVTVGGRCFETRWGEEKPEDCHELVEIPVSEVVFPLSLRGWEQGDRIRLPYGTKKLKKLFGEGRVPKSERKRTPVLSDAEGRILWVVGLASSALLQPRTGATVLFLGIRNVESN